MIDVPTVVYDNPALLGGLTVTLIVAAYYQRHGLGYRDTVALTYIKARAFAVLDPIATRHGRPLTHDASDDDYLATMDEPPRSVSNAIRPPAQANLASMAKYRSADDGDRQWAHSQWAILYEHEGDPWQTEVYLFESPSGETTDVYAHAERATTDPEGHTEGESLAGDSHSRFADAYTTP